MVGGIHPDLPFEYYLELLRGIKEVRPELHIQAFTCVEIAHLAGLAGKPVEETLQTSDGCRAWFAAGWRGGGFQSENTSS